jgi:hypothetical protein
MNDPLDLTPLGVILKTRNQSIDAVFYDVGALTFQEWLALNPLTDKKGKIVVVSPSGSTGQTIRHHGSVEEFLRSDDWRKVVAIAVAGVGSSVLGTAALARNVADACRGDVAGVVSGYGVSDAVLEALGGWYFYGKMDQLRYVMGRSLDDLSALLAQAFAKGPDIRQLLSKYFDLPLDDNVPPSPDVMAIYSILLQRYYDPKSRNLRLLVGHSKGNLLIGDVLNHFNFALRNIESSEDKAFQDLAVVTLGAVVDIPTDVIPEKNQYQFLGTLDALGVLNSRSLGGDIAPRHSIPGAWHSLNTKLLGHMDVVDILTKQVTLPPPPMAAAHAESAAAHVETEDSVAVQRRNRLTAAFNAMAKSPPSPFSAMVNGH